MPLESIFYATATELDAALVEGLAAAIPAGLAWAEPQLRVALSIYVIGNALLMMYGKMDAGGFLHAVVRAMAVAAILKASNYNYYVRDLFFTDLPNAIAAALNGPRVEVGSAQQFDVLWSAVLNYTATVLSQAAGWDNLDDRLVIWTLAFADHGALWVCFGMWYISRVFMALVIAMGPFLILLYLFQGTRGYVTQWVGKLVGLTVLGLSASILLRLLLVVLNSRLRAIGQPTETAVDVLIANAASVTGVFWFGAVLMVAMPSAVAIGSGMGAGVAITAGSAWGAAGTAGRVIGSTVGTAGRVGMALGRYTGK